MATEGHSTSSRNQHARLSTQSSVKTSSSRCTQCSGKNPKSSRNIVVCIDGTSNQFGQKNTNVVKLFSQIDLETPEVEQYAYYTSGIGTRPKSLHILSRMERAISDKFDMAIAWNMEEIVKDAYGWLAKTYQEGDQIYLFGFSRGAYQVRVLAGMIHEVGLIRTSTEKQIGTAYDYYEAIRSQKPKTKQIAREFKNTFSWKDLRIHFVGVWDTVSSVGLIRGDVFLSTSSSAAHACHFRHALALDELRVKFMPEYFHEMNSQVYDIRSKYSVNGDRPAKARQATVIDNFLNSPQSDSKEPERRTTEIKEVWFAGSHSDVGGRNRPGRSQQAGNVSLLWMRREAVEGGLVLRPTDIVWVPDDLDFGTSDSMSFWWRIVEWLPIKHQTCFSGAGEDTRRSHGFQPRRIIPGQKVHASILYANAYKPRATLGEGFDIPIIHAEPEDTDLDNEIWEHGLFDGMAVEKLLEYLSSQQGIAPIYLDRLLFMLRFKEGKESVQKLQNWRELLKGLIERNTSLVRLVALVAYYEAAYDTTKGAKSPEVPDNEFKLEIFNDAKTCLKDILAAHKHRDGPRVVALLRPLAKHENLRKHILTQEVLDSLVTLLDRILSYPGGHFGQAMDGLNCLLLCDQTREMLVEKLKEPSPYPFQHISRLSRILQIEEPQLLTAALRMVWTFARIPEATPAGATRKVEEAEAKATRLAEAVNTAEGESAKALLESAKAAEEAKEKALKAWGVDAEFWSQVKYRLRRLAERDDRLVGCLAVEILLALYNEKDKRQLDLRNTHVRANVASALISLKPKKHNLGVQQTDVAPEQNMFRKLFGFGADSLDDRNRRLIQSLKGAVEGNDARERTAATLTLLKLCETPCIRIHLRDTGLFDVFVEQMQRKNSALLAAYALATCLKYPETNESIKNHRHLAKHIVGMLRMDYFDDAVGQVEGFQIFADFMRQAELRKVIEKFNITEVLDTKLGKGKPKEVRTSLICLEIFLSFDKKGPWARQLVEKSLEYLDSKVWKIQKAGVMILSALAQTKEGVNVIRESITKIVGMLVPKDYQPINLQKEHASSTSASARLHIEEGTPPGSAPLNDHLPTIQEIPASSLNDRPEEEKNPAGPASQNEGQVQATKSPHISPSNPWGATSQPSSWMMGPACALRILAQNADLRKRVSETQEYTNLKNLHLTGMLVSEKDTSPWSVKTPNRTDVTVMLDKMIKAIDEEISEEGLMSIGDTVLPHIAHWDRLNSMLRNRAVGALTILPAMLGISAVAILAAVLVMPAYLLGQAIVPLKQLWSQRQNSHVLDRLWHRGSEGTPVTQDDGPLGGHQANGLPDSETTHAEGSGDAQRLNSIASQE